MQHEFEFNNEKIVINIEGEEYQHYKELAVCILVEREKDLKKCNRNDTSVFPFVEIDAIDGIDVSVCLLIDNLRDCGSCSGYRILLNITDDNDHEIEFMRNFLQCKIEKVTIDIMIGCLIQMKHKLSIVRFCNMECNFQHVKKIENNMKRREIIKSIFQCDNIKINGDICSVCHELTSKTLNCTHHLCVKCFQSMRKKMLKELEDNDESRNLQCPLCREEFSIYSYF